MINKTASMMAVPMAMMLSGCAAVMLVPVPFRALPITVVTQYSDGVEYTLTGDLTIKTDRSASFVISSADDDLKCTGVTNPQGKGTYTCTGGIRMEFQTPKDQYGKFNGAFVEKYDGYISAVGWGEGSDPDKLRRMLAQEAI